MKTMITYKQNEKWIYDEVEKHSTKGGWIKDVLAEYIKGNLVKRSDYEQNQNTTSGTNTRISTKIFDNF